MSVKINPHPGYEAAVRAGAAYRRSVLRDAEMLTAHEVGERLRVSGSRVDQMRKAKALLAMADRTHDPRFPKWQFEPGVRDSMRALLAALEGFDDWAVYLFFVHNNPLLDDISPLDALRAGEVDRVLAAAESIAAAMR